MCLGASAACWTARKGLLAVQNPEKKAVAVPALDCRFLGAWRPVRSATVEGVPGARPHLHRHRLHLRRDPRPQQPRDKLLPQHPLRASSLDVGRKGILIFSKQNWYVIRFSTTEMHILPPLLNVTKNLLYGSTYLPNTVYLRSATY